MEGRVLSGVGGFYTVLSDDDGQRYTLRAQAKLRRKRLTPLVGDRVAFTPGQGEEDGWLEDILPRRNALVRPPVANIDRLAVSLSAGAPEPDFLLVDRMLAFARINGISPILVINKLDGAREGVPQAIARQYRGAAEGIYPVSAATGEGIDELREALWGGVHAFGGQSGVGKSTLINRLYGLHQETGRLSEKIDRGRNTTRHCELIPLEGGGMVLDTPGFSLLELPLMDPAGMPALMPEFGPYEGQCRFAPCMHASEPGCAVRAAVEEGNIASERWERYKELFGDMTQRWRDRYD